MSLTIEHVITHGMSIQDAKELIIAYKGEVFTYFDEGLTRFVFVNPDQTKVVKILKNDLGRDYNEEEINIYEKASEENKQLMAKTELNNGLIEQEFCLPIKFSDKSLTIPQRLFASSCRNEVGWIEDRLVCFDLDEFKKY